MKLKPFRLWSVFGPMFQSALRKDKTKFFNFFFIGASAVKSFLRTRIFRYGLPRDILRKWQKKQGRGGGRTVPPPPIGERVKDGTTSPWSLGLIKQMFGQVLFCSMYIACPTLIRFLEYFPAQH